MPFNWRRPFTNHDDDAALPTDANPGAGTPDLSRIDSAEVTDGSLKYTLEKGGNNSLPSYQEASGAPVESHSPLGYSVGPVTIIFLNVSKMIGTGVYSTRTPTTPPHSTPRPLFLPHCTRQSVDDSITDDEHVSVWPCE